MPATRESSGEPKLPVTQLFILSLCRLAEPIALSSVFPYLPEMIESFDVPRNEVAKWAGITSAVFSVSQALTAIPWGRASDKYGRKPIILLALTCAMGSSLLFGFSTSLKWAIVSRALSGASNGNVGILRTTVAEMVPHRSLQPRAFSLLPLVWQVGSIVGPVLGGALASPSTSMPQLFGKNKFLKTFPFALPNLVNGVFFAIGIIEGFLFLKESLESKKHSRDYGRVLGSYLIEPCTRSKRDDNLTDDYESKTPLKTRRKPDNTPPPSYREVFTRQSNLGLLSYCILALHSVPFGQLLPVFLHLPVDREGISLPFKFTGGFGLESGRIGVIFTIYAVFCMTCQFTIFPMVTKRYGVLFCMRACTFVIPFTYIVTPYTVLMPTPTTQQAAILAVMFVQGFAGVFAFPCMTILLTNSASSLRLLGTLNGVATALSAVAKAAGPYLGGRTFTWGAEAGYIIAAWWLMAAFAIAGHISTWWLVEMDGFAEKEKKQLDDDEHEYVRLVSTAHAARTGLNADSVVPTTEEEDESEDDLDDVVEDKPLLQSKWKELE
jgi:MFS family permease